ncbi:carnitine dehydratase [Sporosarcina sp. P13]|nr:carnitine dehydratase [Sporosarcina sp. P13]
MYINGEWTSPTDGEYFPSHNPATGEAWCEVAKGSAVDVDNAVQAAHAAFLSPEWRKMTPTQRGHLVSKLGELIAENVETLAKFETLDNGKLIREMRGQLQYLPEFYHYYGGLANKIQGNVLPIDKPDMLVYSVREPLGVIAAITPWNSPLYLTTLKLAPALITGNTIVIKPSEMTSASILEFVKLVEKAGFPAGVVNVVTGFGMPVGDALTSHPLVRRIAFTGGEVSARKVVENSAKNFASLSLELGGKSPNIVFEDANLDNAAMGIIAGIFSASGQSCVAGSRAFIHKNVYDKVMEKLVHRVEQIKIGDPLQEETEMGPLATEAQLQRVEQYVDWGLKEGGKLICGGKRPENIENGWYFEPTIFEHADNTSKITREEIFGPILSVIPFEDEDEVIQLANSTEYGLATGIWTQDIGRAHRVSAEIRAGIVWINTYRSVSPIVPIGGSGLTGYGRESGMEVVHEYTQTKSVWVNTSDKIIEDPFKWV